LRFELLWRAASTESFISILKRVRSFWILSTE
jgi:hypothetical protein